MISAVPTLAREAHDRIIGMILGAELRSGDVLGEARLGEVLGMSRTPVREALRQIESEGLAAKSGRFLRVRRLEPGEFEEIFFLRMELEPRCAAAAVDLDPAVWDGPERDIRALMRDGPGPDTRQWQVDEHLHQVIASAGHNPVIASVIEDLRRRTCIFDHTQVPDRFATGCAEHLGLLEAIRRGDRAGAEAAMRGHLVNARDAVLGRLGDLMNNENY